MTRAVVLSDVGTGIVAIIDSAPGGGALTNSAALCNRPAIDPGNWPDKSFFNSLCDYYELLDMMQSVTVHHTSLATGSTGGTIVNGWTVTAFGNTRYTDILLYDHGQSFIPPYMIAYSGARLVAGQYVQIDGTGFSTRTRMVSHWADLTGIYLSEIAVTTDTDLDAADRDYQVLTFNRPVADPDVPPLHFDNASGVLGLGRNMVRSDRQYLRKALSGDSSFDFNLGQTGAVENGAIKVVSGGVAYEEPGFTGTFPGPDFVPVSGVF